MIKKTHTVDIKGSVPRKFKCDRTAAYTTLRMYSSQADHQELSGKLAKYGRVKFAHAGRTVSINVDSN